MKSKSQTTREIIKDLGKDEKEIEFLDFMILLNEAVYHLNSKIFNELVNMNEEKDVLLKYLI